MRRRRDGQQIVRRIEAGAAQHCGQRRVAGGEVGDRSRIEPDEVAAIELGLLHDGARHDVARLEFVDESLATGTAQERSMTP